jgi:hypothetical protein
MPSKPTNKSWPGCHGVTTTPEGSKRAASSDL